MFRSVPSTREVDNLTSIPSWVKPVATATVITLIVMKILTSWLGAITLCTFLITLLNENQKILQHLNKFQQISQEKLQELAPVSAWLSNQIGSEDSLLDLATKKVHEFFN